MKRLFLSILSLGAVLAFLGIVVQGCNKGGPVAVDQPLAEVRLGYFPNLTHAQAVLGDSTGDFQKALGSTKLSVKQFNAGPDLIDNLKAGTIDIGYVGPGPVITAYMNGHGQTIRVISGSAANGVVIVARPGSGIQSMNDLKGKKIATPQLYNTQDISARHYVTEVLGQADDKNILPITNNLQAAGMLHGDIDASWVPEPWGARLMAETGATLVGEEKDQWPGQQFALTVIVTTPKFLAEHPAIVRKILEVHHQWTMRLNSDPKAYADQLNSALAKSVGGKKLPAGVIEGAISRTRFTDDPLPETFATMTKWSEQLRVVKESSDLSGLFDTGIMDKVKSVSPATKP